jgi:superfamily II helicase
MMQAITKLIEACVENINVNELTTFDVEYIFLQLRGKSSGEIIEVGYNCPHCEGSNEIQVDLEHIKISGDIINDNMIIELTPDINLELGYIKYNKMVNSMNFKKNADESAEVFTMVKNAIVSVNTEEERMIFADESLQNQDEFLDSLSSAQFQKITNFLTEGPSVVYNSKHICTSCTKEFDIELKGMDNFF